MEKPDLHTETKSTRRNPVRGRQNQYVAYDARTALVKAIVDGENAARDAKTAKLRALRLAKEKADENASGDAAPSATAKSPKTRRAKIVRD